LTLENLTDGQHTLKVYAENDYVNGGAFDSNGTPTNILKGVSTVIFGVDTTAPVISSMSIQNKTYAKKDLLLTFSSSEPSEMWYCLDGQANTPIIGNSTMLNGLSEGVHTLQVYANDTFGRIGSTNLIQFSIDTATPAPTVSPTLEPTSTPKQPSGFLGTNLPMEYGYALVAVLVVMVVAGLSLVYFKRYRRKVDG
jgi:hypothetical protein